MPQGGQKDKIQPGMSIDAMQITGPDPEATAGGDFGFGDLGAGKRQVMSEQQLLASLTVLMRGGEGCEAVTVIQVSRLEPTDRKDGCNWALAIVLDPAGVAPEVYSLAYASMINTARESWNLE
jgi:hypothetical protein